MTVNVDYQTSHQTSLQYRYLAYHVVGYQYAFVRYAHERLGIPLEDLFPQPGAEPGVIVPWVRESA